MIMEITSAANGPLQRAAEVEGLLIREMRRWGNTAMESWAAKAEQVLADRLKAQDASARVLKKNAAVVVRVRSGERQGTDLEHRREEVSAVDARRDRRPTARAVGSFAAGVDGLWLRAFLWAGGGPGAGTLRFCDGSQRGAGDDPDAGAAGAGAAGPTISGVVPPSAGHWSSARHRGSRWHDDLHGGSIWLGCD